MASGQGSQSTANPSLLYGWLERNLKTVLFATTLVKLRPKTPFALNEFWLNFRSTYFKYPKGKPATRLSATFLKK